MKVLLVNHGRAGEWGGGDGVQMRETAKRLNQRGHEVTLVNSDLPDARGYDIVHLFNCRVQDSFEQQMASCQAAQVPVVVSPIWVSIGRALWGSRASVGILQQALESGEDTIQPLLKQLKQRTLAVQLADGSIVQSHGGCDNGQTAMPRVGELLNHSQALLPNSWLELQAVRTDHHWTGSCFDIAHYGVDPQLFLDADPKPFQNQTGIQQPFVLQAGRIEPAKNQAMLCWALKNTNLPVVLIGGKQHWPSYADLCKSILGDRLTIIEHLPQDLLASAYAAAGVHVLPSWMETCGLVTLEAALSGTPVVGSTFGHELEYLQQDAWHADPADPSTIRDAVTQAWQAGRHNQRSCRLKRRILEQFNWEQTTDATESIYKKVLNGTA
ncbi:glycosyltransferase family 4 protein [Synechococcus sp. UW179B]|uniref:glycosyltransferase family 4 protein n=1 Tax=Synechococcus sp. UW179B TaxID=2575516 RepID=UPI000E0FDDC9|nr:glycosyltransferase family 4 protein [Synechococcus sp. UW179B]